MIKSLRVRMSQTVPLQHRHEYLLGVLHTSRPTCPVTLLLVVSSATDGRTRRSGSATNGPTTDPEIRSNHPEDTQKFIIM